jgi:uncharacterized protein YhfF
MTADDLPVAEFGFPGPLRDKLVSAILSGEKTTTTGLLAVYEYEGEAVPRAGRREAVVDSSGERVAVIEITEVDIIPVREVTGDFARDEGEGYETVELWREAHQRFFQGDEMRAALGGTAPEFEDDSLVVAIRFRLAERLLA